MKRKIKLGLSGLNASNMADKADYVVSKMTDNPNFATPVPPLPEIMDAVSDLRLAMAIAESGLKNARFERDVKYNVVDNLLRQLAHYITGIANGEPNILTSSGFDVQKLPEPISSIDTPVNCMAASDGKAGSIKVDWNHVQGARSYVVEITTMDPNAEDCIWTMAALSTKSSAVIQNLERATYYWCRVKAVGSRAESGFSKACNVLAA